MLKKCHPAILCTLVTLYALGPATGLAQSPGETGGAATQAARPRLYPARRLRRGHRLPAERLEVAPPGIPARRSSFDRRQEELGLDPAEIEQAIIVAEPPKGFVPPEWAVVLKMASPIAGDVLPALVPHTIEDTLDGKSYRKGKSPDDPSIYQAGERTLIVGSDGLLRKAVANDAAPAEGRLKTMLLHSKTPDLLCVILIEPLRPLLASMASGPMPPPLADLREGAKLIDYVAFKANLCDSLDAMLLFRANDGPAAERLGGIIDGLLAMAQQSADAEAARQEASRDPVEQATAKYAKRMFAAGR